MSLGICLFFFFSSRRRHTRSLCDWSSDVCSSDLLLHPVGIDSHSDEVTGWSKLSCNGHAILIQLAHVVIRACEAGWQHNMTAKLICTQIIILRCISKTLIKLCSDCMLMSSQPSEIELFCSSPTIHNQLLKESSTTNNCCRLLLLNTIIKLMHSFK